MFDEDSDDEVVAAFAPSVEWGWWDESPRTVPVRIVAIVVTRQGESWMLDAGGNRRWMDEGGIKEWSDLLADQRRLMPQDGFP